MSHTEPTAALVSEVIKSVKNRLHPAQVEAAFKVVLGNTLKAQGLQPLSPAW